VIARDHVVPPLFLALGIALFASAPVAAQPPDTRRIVTRPATDAPMLSFRPFVMGAEQAFAAVNTFEAVFGQAHEPFFGGGLQVIVKSRYYVEVGASRFRKTGERVFRSNDENFRLGLPVTAEIRPFEVTGGYRFEMHANQRIVPYGSGGLGSYGYKETSPSSDPDENVDVRHRGFVINGGVEVRVHPWVHIAVDEQYTHVPGILGSGGLSQALAEDDLGGIAVRFKVVVGR
jgi:hypothetical protein